MKYELSRIGTLTEIAADLGLTYGRAGQLPNIKGFPEPIWVFGLRNRVWDLDAVQKWYQARRNIPALRRKEQLKMMLESIQDELEELEE